MRHPLLVLAALAIFPVVLLAPTGGRAAFPGASGKIAFDSDRTGSEQIYTVAASGGPVSQLTTEGRNYSPAWSPDGTRIAFESDRDDDSAIYEMNADGSGETRLTAGRLPAWSADGSEIGFIALTGPEGDQHYGIFTVNSSGGTPSVLIDSPLDDTMPAFSPDGTKIAYSSAEGSDDDLEIYVADSDGSNPVPLTQNDTADYYPAWSPDSSQIAWECRGPSPGVCVMNADGSEQHMLPSISAGNDQSPAWSPDGTRIAVETYTPPDFLGGIYTMNPDGSDPQMVTEQGDYEPDWQPLSSPASPTPSPSPTPEGSPTHTSSPNRTQGDVNCNGEIDEQDELQILYYAADLDPGNPPPCPDLNDETPSSGFPWGDLNCDGNVDAIDALYLIAFRAGFLDVPPGSVCTPIGDDFT